MKKTNEQSQTKEPSANDAIAFRARRASESFRRFSSSTTFLKKISATVHPQTDRCPKQMRHMSIMKSVPTVNDFSAYATLFGCFEECLDGHQTRFFTTCCCPCFTAAVQARRISGADLSFHHWLTALSCSCVVTCGCMYILLAAQTRDVIVDLATGNEHLGLESCCIHIFCHPCALIQQDRVLDELMKLANEERSSSSRTATPTKPSLDP